MGFFSRNFLSSAIPLLLLTMLTKPSTKSQMERYLPIAIDCQKDFPLTVEDMASFKKAETFPSGPNAPCFAACFAKKLGIMDETGQFSESDLLEETKLLNEDETDYEKAEKLIKYCLSVNLEEIEEAQDASCERAKLGIQCMFENAKEYDINLR